MCVCCVCLYWNETGAGAVTRSRRERDQRRQLRGAPRRYSGRQRGRHRRLGFLTGGPDSAGGPGPHAAAHCFDSRGPRTLGPVVRSPRGTAGFGERVQVQLHVERPVQV